LPRSLSWIYGGLLLRERRGGRTGGKGKRGEKRGEGTYFKARGEEGREERGGEG